ncbi:MAG: hypothetical protein WA954_04290 [Parerythrobacter sp.]
MTTAIRPAILFTTALALAACGGTEDASYEAEAETVEIPAAEAMEEVVEEPVVAPAPAPEPAPVPTATGVAPSVVAEADTAADEAEAAVADIEALIGGSDEEDAAAQ